MNETAEQRRWIDGQQDRMAELVERWANINSGSRNVEGVGRMAEEVRSAFEPLGGRAETIELPPRELIDETTGERITEPLGPALRIEKRPGAKRRVLLAIHTDTVYGPDDPFQRAERADAETLRGPGVADAKGGIAVMLTALEALERRPAAEHLGWRVLLNPDEELGSPGSAPLLRESAAGCAFGLVYEPALEGGALAGARKGSGNFTVVVRGVSAHAGRHFERGRNAVAALSRLLAELDALNGQREGVTVNVARVVGGGASNVVPDLAVGRFNVRCVDAERQRWAEDELRRVIGAVNERDGLSAELHGGFGAPPKPLDGPTLELLRRVRSHGQTLGVNVDWRDTGGVCDGNRLAAAGLPTVDTMGPRGGAIHSRDEYLLLDSLAERAKLSAALLIEEAERMG